MHKTRVQDLVLGLICAALGVFMWLNTAKLTDDSKQFSRFVLALFLLMSVILIVISLINAKKPSGKEVKIGEFKNPMLMYLIIVGYVALMVTLGFFVASAIFMPAAMLYLGYRKPIPMICVTAGMLGFVWLLFVYSLKVRLPSGLLF